MDDTPIMMIVAIALACILVCTIASLCMEDNYTGKVYIPHESEETYSIARNKNFRYGIMDVRGKVYVVREEDESILDITDKLGTNGWITTKM